MPDRVEVRKWHRDNEQYELSFTYFPDGTVEGDDHHANELRYIVDEIIERGETPEDWFVNLAARMVTNWENGLYLVDVYNDG